MVKKHPENGPHFSILCEIWHKFGSKNGLTTTFTKRAYQGQSWHMPDQVSINLAFKNSQNFIFQGSARLPNGSTTWRDALRVESRLLWTSPEPPTASPSPSTQAN